MGFKIAGYTKKSKMNLARGGQNFASFAKSGDKIANLATLPQVEPSAVGVRGRRRGHRARREGNLPLRQEEPRPPQRLHQGGEQGYSI